MACMLSVTLCALATMTFAIDSGMDCPRLMTQGGSFVEPVGSQSAEQHRDSHQYSCAHARCNKRGPAARSHNPLVHVERRPNDGELCKERGQREEHARQIHHGEIHHVHDTGCCLTCDDGSDEKT